ncbi:RecBCD enzyme subunit RecB [Candidatus Desulfarcum epimagneticum]|uniref:DNA 3'-5' helicase n=1 Tax=uncultured Desulfobacteraceae bacterium TaxID=218296 RepID=A0A484HBS1_9BACT|nr:RecBCD enzyme subunit RecB [uncultured Desulfobacteraceae bacterium]
MKTFNLAEVPLSGVNLIEAGAGTGKTYAIAGLFLRLIVEKKTPVNKILVVTFTQAATDELKRRMRSRLVEAGEAFLSGVSGDPFLEGLVKKTADGRDGLFLIRRALAEFDEAPVFTIHGFCRRMLSDSAFESGRLFDCELATGRGLHAEIAEDFWRRRVCASPPEFVVHLMSRKISGPDYYQGLLERVKAPDAEIVPDIEKPSLDSLGDYRKAMETLRREWPRRRKEVRKIFYDPSLKASVFGSLKPSRPGGFSNRDARVCRLMENMDRLAAPRGMGFPFFKGFESFTPGRLAELTKKKFAPPRHDIFDICGEIFDQGTKLTDEMDRLALFFDIRFMGFARREMERRKRRRNIQSFDDLLSGVRDALAKKENASFAAGIRDRYDAALIDEFQDTDFLQYDIFERLFAAPGKTLFMIGDPKQAIYGFRGADVFSYMKAAQDAPFRHTLLENWRSAPGLVEAVNAVFSGGLKKPFVLDGMDFVKARPAPRPDPGEGPFGAPLKLWLMRGTNDGGKSRPVAKAEAVRVIARAVARQALEIAASPKRPFGPGDMAVLTRTNRQARIVRDAFSSLGIPAILYDSGNIFESREAFEMNVFLAALADPFDRRLLASALATDMMGLRAGDMDAENLPGGRSRAGDMAGRMKTYRRIWKTGGFMRMFGAMMEKEKVRRRLLSYPDGERRLTNLLHLSEILHDASSGRGGEIRGLAGWLGKMRKGMGDDPEESRLRLESDRHAVSVVTIHKSKGLEYPVVFCPFCWEGVPAPGKPVLFHDPEKEGRLVCDFGSGDMKKSASVQQWEALAENARLLYVALTRAKSLCHLFWGRIRSAEKSALAYLLHCAGRLDETGDPGSLVQAVEKEFLRKTDGEILADLKALEKRSRGAIEVLELDGEGPGDFAPLPRPREQRLLFRPFSGKIDDSWKVSSFSSLAAGPDPEPFGDFLHGDFGDDGKWEPTPPRETEPLDDEARHGDIVHFPRGARSGLFFHELFECLDFRSRDMDQRQALVREKMEKYDVDPAWKTATLAMIKHTLEAPLSRFPDRPGGADFCLADVPLEDRITEMEFYFPMGLLDPGRLERVFSDAGPGVSPPAPALARMARKLSFSPCRGFMKGFIDLAFRRGGRWHIVDWKSNFLGTGPADYRPSRLLSAMEEHAYFLQYHIYTAALSRYLSLKEPGYDYDSGFGGVFYLFIRGIRPERDPEFGVFYDRPSRELMERLDRAFQETAS